MTWTRRRAAVAAGCLITAALAVPAAPSAIARSAATDAPAATARAAGPARSAPPPPSPRAALAASYRSALARAGATGRPQVVAAATTAVSQTVASPDGRLVMKINVLPVRVKIHGAWRPVSAVLRRNAAGTWSPVAVQSQVTLSGGGRGPLAVLAGPGGRNLTLSWPRPLPAPVIAGATASYRSALPGINLVVDVSGLGGINVTATAARGTLSQHPLQGLRLRLAGAGLAVTSRRDGAITAAIPGGPALFSGPAPRLWRTSPAPARTGAGSFARATAAIFGVPTRPISAMTVAAAGRALVLSAPLAPTGGGASRGNVVSATVSVGPDTASATTCGKGKSGGSSGSGTWCTIRNTFAGVTEHCGSHYPNSEGSDGLFEGNLVGQDFWGASGNGSDACGKARAFYVMDTSSLTSDMRIQTATLHTWLAVSADTNCTASYRWPLHLYDLGRGAQVDNTTTWPGPGLPGSPYKTDQLQPVYPPNSNCTNNHDVSFDVWQPIVNAKSGGYDYWTFAFTGAEGGSYDFGGDCDPSDLNGDNCGLMRIGDENTLENSTEDDTTATEFPYVVITFDLVPKAPGINPAGDTSPVAYDIPPDIAGDGAKVDNGCGANSGWVNSTSVNLRVDLPAPDTRMSGEPVTAWYALTDMNTVNTTTFHSVGSYTDGYYTDTPIPFTLSSGHYYSWDAWSEVDGPNGTPDPYGPYDSGNTGPCAFSVDTSKPVNVGVTSTDFPKAGSGTEPAKHAGDQGTFKVTATDNPPSSCSQCVESYVYGYAYSLNNPDISPSVSNTVKVGSDGSGTITLTPGDWGLNNLYVEAIDNAGNISDVYDYPFYAPWNPNWKWTPGDVSDPNGETPQKPDLLATTGTGGLSLYNDPGVTASSWPAPVSASGPPAVSPDGTADWNLYDITHRGSETQNAPDDLWAIQPGSPTLYLYVNNPLSPGTNPYGTGQVSQLPARPGCNTALGNNGNCPSGDWSGVHSILAVGDAWQGDPLAGINNPNCNSTNINCDFQFQASLITAENNGQLWLYQDEGGSTLINPVQLGSTGWNNMTLLAPGTINRHLTIWARDNTSGLIYAYPLYLTKNGIPTLDPAGTATPITATSGTTLPGITLKADPYKYLATPGDANTPNGPSLYAIDTSGNILIYPANGDPNGNPSTTPVKPTPIIAGSITGLG